MKAQSKQPKCGGSIVVKNGLHTHIKDRATAEAVKELINCESRPNKAFIEHLKHKTTIQQLEEGLDRAQERHLIKDWRKWKYWREKKQKYVNVNKGHRRVI